MIPLRASVPPAGPDGASTARSVRPPYDVEGLPDAAHDESGVVFNTGKVRALRPVSSSGSIPTPTGGHRPPVLASEVLREDLTPHEPGALMLRRVTLACAATTLLVALVMFGGSLAGLTVAALAAAQMAAALMPLNYPSRATVLVALTTALLAGATVANVIGGADSHPGLVLPVLVLSTGLLFRSWHRASRDARIIVSSGVALSAAWLGWSDSIAVAFSGDPSWQSWLPAATRLALAPILLLSLLAFMGETATGGCAAWAGCALAWYGAVNLVDVVAAAWNAGVPTAPWDSLRSSVTGARLIAAAAAPILAVGVAQLLVIAASDPSATNDSAQ